MGMASGVWSNSSWLSRGGRSPCHFANRTPRGLAAILGRAFEFTLCVPQFPAEAAKIGRAVEPADGETVQQALANIYGASSDIVAQGRAAIEP